MNMIIFSVIAGLVFLISIFVTGADNLKDLIHHQIAEVKNSCSGNRARVKCFYESLLPKLMVQFHCKGCQDFEEKFFKANCAEITKLYTCIRELHNEDSENTTDNKGHLAHAIHEYTSPFYFYCRNRKELIKVGRVCFDEDEIQVSAMFSLASYRSENHQLRCKQQLELTTEALSHFSSTRSEPSLASLCKITRAAVNCPELHGLEYCGASQINRWLKFLELVYRGLMSTYYEESDDVSVPNECVEVLDFLTELQIVNESFTLAPSFILIFFLNYIAGFQIFKAFCEFVQFSIL